MKRTERETGPKPVCYFFGEEDYLVEEALEDIKKKTLTKGKIWVVIRLTSSWDPKKDFDRNSFFGQLKAFYMNYIYRRRLLEGGFHRRFRTEQSGLYQVMLRTLKSERRDFEDAYQQGVHIRA